jgi:hypothetical protein
MFSISNQVVCTPFQKAHNEPVMKGRVVVNKTGLSLEALTVLMDAEIAQGDFQTSIKKGTVVYVKADKYKATWSEKTKIDTFVDDKGTPIEFIFVPFSEILLITC